MLIGCTEQVDSLDHHSKPFVKKDPLAGLSLDDAIKRHLGATLSIPATEKYTYEIYRGDCNGDDSLDMVITVNLLDRALDAAINSGNTAKRAELGYMGNYNYFVYVDGFTRKFGAPKPIASSPHAKLVVNFDHIRTEKQKDFTIDYRIRDSGYRNFYTIVNGNPVHILQVPIFDGIGKTETSASKIRLEPGTLSTSKDVVVYEGSFENATFDDPMDIYTFEPKIVGTDKIVRRWFFSEAAFKYYTEKDQSN
ncbi:MAG: hypothetical protein ACI837_001782 [Crocinitomicaceae bacterium]|jgi:hypothetical protein